MVSQHDVRAVHDDLADRAVLERPRLIDHFRCQPEIIAICDELCSYGLRIHTPRQGPAAPLPFLAHPVSLIDVVGEQERAGGSWHNAAELALMLELFQALMAAGIAANEVAVITPYRGQLEQLRKQFARLGIPIDYSSELLDLDEPRAVANGGVALGTVHRFQGGERSIVLFSSVVTRPAALSFLDQHENLLNVAVSRARHRFVALGSRAVLAAGKRTRLLTQAAHALSPEAFRPQLGLYARLAWLPAQ
jgi:superfamily I DNA and/or RNA helicase